MPAFLDYLAATLYLREAKGSFNAGTTKMSTEQPHGTSNVLAYYRKQFEALFARVRGSKTLENGCCDLQKNAEILKVIDAMY